MNLTKNYVTRDADLNSNIGNHAVLDIIGNLKRHGYETYLVGGAVRDMLIDRIPKDYDVSTSATPEEIREVFSRKRARIIGRRFRIVHVRAGSQIIEVSTFRKSPSKKEIEEADNELESLRQEDDINHEGHDEENNDENSHHHHKHHQHKHSQHVDHSTLIIRNDNEYGTAYEDAWRRDFTVNAIFYDPVKKQIIDYTAQGLSDLENKIVRVIGDPQTRYSEDPVRMLRALKLVGQYGFTLEEKTQSALLEMQQSIQFASNSRLSLELEKILKKPYACDIIKTFYQYGFLANFLPNLHSVFQSKETQLAIQLLETRCDFINQNLIPDYLTNAMSVIALPFIASEFSGNHENAIFHYEHDQKKPMRRVLRSVFYPLNFPRWMVYEAIDAIFMQNRLFSGERSHKIKKHRSFYSAFDLARVVNHCIVKDEKFEVFWEKLLHHKK
ncbi:MAG: hypothetical protein A2X47_01705 [Lentisphaerae bacterium GWF2_38_69]|nr:MAG: hypothetical protein A2X47_01705 [Lentisphaerae bacterium GWF2_38_69]